MTPLTQQERASLTLRVLTAAATASDAKLIALTKLAEGPDAPAIEPPRVVDGVAEYAQVPPMTRADLDAPAAEGRGYRRCCECHRPFYTGGNGPVVRIKDGRWRCGTVHKITCPTRKHEPATDCEVG